MVRHDIKDLASLLSWLASLPAIDRAQVANMLVAHDTAKAVAAVRRAAIYEATRTNTYAEVARRLGVSDAAINKAVSEHKRSAA